MTGSSSIEFIHPHPLRSSYIYINIYIYIREIREMDKG